MFEKLGNRQTDKQITVSLAVSLAAVSQSKLALWCVVQYPQAYVHG